MKIEELRTELLPLSKLTTNTGQIEGLPKNPRFIRNEKFEALKKSLQDDPEMMKVREVIVFPFAGRFVIIGGNMRYRAAKDLGWTEIPCKVLPADTPTEKLRAYTIKDNNQFGEWDWDIANNEWDVDEWKGFGIDFFGFDPGKEEDEEDGSTEIDQSDIDGDQTLKLRYTPQEYAKVTAALKEIDPKPEQALLKLLKL